jgi:hypothetical protein
LLLDWSFDSPRFVFRFVFRFVVKIFVRFVFRFVVRIVVRLNSRLVLRFALIFVLNFTLICVKITSLDFLLLDLVKLLKKTKLFYHIKKLYCFSFINRCLQIEQN